MNEFIRVGVYKNFSKIIQFLLGYLILNKDCADFRWSTVFSKYITKECNVILPIGTMRLTTIRHSTIFDILHIAGCLLKKNFF